MTARSTLTVTGWITSSATEALGGRPDSAPAYSPAPKASGHLSRTPPSISRTVGQAIVFCGLFGRACGPRNFMKKRPALAAPFAECSLFGGLLLSSTSAGFSTLPARGTTQTTRNDRLRHRASATGVSSQFLDTAELQRATVTAISSRLTPNSRRMEVHFHPGTGSAPCADC
jgi:hypothetical protein